MFSHCLCALRPKVPTQAGMCLLMADIEPLKPSNTGWLIADVVADTFAFGWARTAVDPRLLTLLVDPQWQPYGVFPGEFVTPERIVTALLPEVPAMGVMPKRPLFVLLDATWAEAGNVFTHHDLQAKNQQPLDLQDAAHQRLRDLSGQRQSKLYESPMSTNPTSFTNTQPTPLCEPCASVQQN